MTSNTVVYTICFSENLHNQWITKHVCMRSDTSEIYLGENRILCSVVIVTEHFIGFQVLLNDLQLGFIST